MFDRGSGCRASVPRNKKAEACASAFSFIEWWSGSQNTQTVLWDQIRVGRNWAAWVVGAENRASQYPLRWVIPGGAGSPGDQYGSRNRSRVGGQTAGQGPRLQRCRAASLARRQCRPKTTSAATSARRCAGVTRAGSCKLAGVTGVPPKRQTGGQCPNAIPLPCRRVA